MTRLTTVYGLAKRKRVVVSPSKRDRSDANALGAVTADQLIGSVVVGRRPLSALYADDPMLRVAVVRRGLPATIVPRFSVDMGLTKEGVYSALGMNRQTALRKDKQKEKLSTSATERGVCIAGLIRMVESMTGGTAPADFKPAEWLAHWLTTPHPALDRHTPSSLLDTSDGRKIVTGLLGQIEGGAYA